MTRGLVVGKFTPFHRGHQHVIETALAAVDEIVVLVYDGPDDFGMPLARRAAWVRAVCPAARVIAGHDGPREVGDDPRVMRLHEDYVRRVVPQPVTHFFSSEWYGGHMSRALGAEDVRVDPDRRAFPVSATLVRSDPYRWRTFVPPVVYRDLVRRVAFVGAESTGKTTIARAAAEAFGTAFMPEHGRDYWVEHQIGGELTAERLVELAEGHAEREDRAALDADRFLFVDTNALTTAIYARHWHGGPLPRLAALADACRDRYASTFLCGDDAPYDDDGTRAGTATRAKFQAWIREDLEQRRVPFVELRGPVTERLAAVRDTLRR